MEKLEVLARIAEWLALPLTYFILLVLFLFFIVRPFFSHLFNWDRIMAVRALQETRKKMEMPQQADATGDEQGAAGDEPVPGNRDDQ